MNQLQTADLIVLIAYLTATIAIGLWAGRNSGTTDAFMAAKGQLPGWAVGLSIFGTYVSSISFLAIPGKAYASNWNLLAFSFAIPLTAWIAVRYFVPFYRDQSAISSYEHLEHRFGPWARTYAVACYLLTQLARMGMILYLLALVLSPLIGMSVSLLIVLLGAVVIVYTLFGGIEAVIWTDVMQSVVLIVGALTCVVVLVAKMPSGFEKFLTIANEHEKFSLGSFGPSLSESTFWVVLAYGFFVNLQNFGIDQSYVQRYQTAPTMREARKSVWLGALLYLPVSLIFCLIGSQLFAFYQAQPELLPDSLAGEPDRVFPHFIANQLPLGLAGLVVAALAAAAQSTLSSSINCSATLLLCDVYRRFWRPQAGEKESMRVLWLMSFLMGLAGIGVALAMTRIKSALDAWWGLASIFSGGMLGLFLLGFASRRATNAAAAIGVAMGLAIIAWMSLPTLAMFFPQIRQLPKGILPELNANLAIVVGTLTIFLVGLAVSRWSGKPAIRHAEAES